MLRDGLICGGHIMLINPSSCCFFSALFQYERSMASSPVSLSETQYRAGNRFRYEALQSQTLTWILSSCVHTRPTHPLCGCSTSLARNLFQGATFKLHFQLFCSYFQHSKHYASIRNGRWWCQDEFFLQISTELQDLWLGCCCTYQRASYHTHAQ